MVSVQVKRCKILKEFTGKQQHQIFGISRDKTLHHIDTLYYSVCLNEPKDIIRLQREDDLPANLMRFLQFLRENKEKIRDFSGDPPRFGDLVMERKTFSIYEYCVSLPECFDIFFSNYLPTESTPRVVVQLRSRYLVLEGVKKAIEESFRALREFLSPFGMLPVRVRENRIDYAFHTNLIQNPDKFFDDDKLRLHLKTNLRKFSKYGDTKNFKLDTLNLGRRTSNSIFFRGYNKARETIEMNYKSFFIERWYQYGLISEFDKYVYETAYNLKAYRSGILVGRLKWYLEFGSDEKLKEKCRKLLASDFVRSDNLDHIEKNIRGIIPEPTLIFNIEYQTKRKFFSTCSEWINFKTDLTEVFNIKENASVDSNICFPQFCDPLLRDLYGIIFSSKDVIDYLTGYGNVVSFVTDRNMSFKQFKKKGEPYMNWWKRLRSTPVNYSYSTMCELYRSYDLKTSFDRSRRGFERSVAGLSMLCNNDLSQRSFVEDMADVLCVLNDNDMERPRFLPNYEIMVGEDGEILTDLTNYDPAEYQEIRFRKSRQLKGVLRKSNSKINDSDPEQDSEEKGS